MKADAEVLARVHRLWTRYAAAIWVETGATIAIYAWTAALTNDRPDHPRPPGSWRRSRP
jgi:hypothetical protein